MVAHRVGDGSRQVGRGHTERGRQVVDPVFNRRLAPLPFSGLSVHLRTTRVVLQRVRARWTLPQGEVPPTTDVGLPLENPPAVEGEEGEAEEGDVVVETVEGCL